MTGHQSRFGWFGLLRRHLRAGRSTGAAVMLLVLICAAVLTAAPGVLDRIGASEIRYDLGNLSPARRYLTARSTGQPVFGPAPTSPAADRPPQAEGDWGAPMEALTAVRDQAPAPLRDHVGAPRVTAYSDDIEVQQPPYDAAAIGQFRVVLATDPEFTRNARLVTGVWPKAVISEYPLSAPLPITLSVAAATRMGWKVGQVRTPLLDRSFGLRLLLTGTFEAVSASDPNWTINPSILLPRVQALPSTTVVTGTAFVAAASWPVAQGLTTANHLQIYYPFEVNSVPVSEVDQLRAQLISFTTGSHRLDTPPGTAAADLTSVRLSTGAPTVMAQALTKVSAADAVLSVLVIGPIGAVLGALLLGCRLLAARRRAAFVLLTRRGLGWWRLRLSFAAEGVLLGVPAAAAAFVVAAAFPADHWRPVAVEVIVVVAAPAAALALSRRDRPAGRTDMTWRALGRWRRIAELSILILAAACTLLLYRSGAGSTPGVDPLAAAAPFALCLAACVVVMRLLPIPLAAANRSFRARSGITGFLGSARAIREPAVGMAPVLSTVIGVAMAVLSAVLLSTLHSGITSAAATSVGADLTVYRPDLSAAEIKAVRSTPGIWAAAGLTTVNDVTVRVAGLQRGITVYLVDSAALSTVQAGIDGAVPIPPGLTDSTGSAIPVVASAGLAGSALSINMSALSVRGSAASSAGLGLSDEWLLMDSTFRARITHVADQPEALLVRIAAGAAASTTVQRIKTFLPDAVTRTAGDAAETLRRAPVIGGVEAVVLAALTMMGLLCAATVLMTTVAGASARRTMVAVLRILGLRPPSVGALVAWELVPVTVTAMFVGTALGAGLCRIITDVVDLRPFTGGTRVPVITISWPQVVELLGAFIAAVAVVSMTSAVRASRAALAVTLRFGDE